MAYVWKPSWLPGAGDDAPRLYDVVNPLPKKLVCTVLPSYPSHSKSISSRSSDCSIALLTIPTPGAAFNTNSTCPNMMYHLDAMSGASPDPATVKEAPFESYVGVPWAVKESDCPAVKSILTDLPSAVSGGQLPVVILEFKPANFLLGSGNVPSVRGLQFVYV